jgi:single-strand DNA-binding protein
MSNFAQTTLVGRLGKDPESRTMPNGKAVVNFSVAVSEKWTKDGEKQERTEWYNCAAFDRTAEIISEYVRKGDLILVVGKQQTDKYEKDGETKYAVKTIVRDVQLMPNNRRGESDDESGQQRRAAPARSRQEPTQAEDFSDDIPF